MRPSTITLLILLVGTIGASGYSLYRHRTVIHAALYRNAELEREVSARSTAVHERDQQIEQLNASVKKLQTESAEREKSLNELGDLRRERDAAKARAEQLAKFVSQFKNLIDAGKLQVEIRRGRLALLMPNDVLFDEGSVEMKPDGQLAVMEVAATLKTVRDRQFQIVGHTDTMPIKTKEFSSNWDLSSARALAVVKLLLEEGVPGSILSASGRGQYEPRSPNATPFGRAQNRRIEIVLEPQMGEFLKQPSTKM